MNLTLSGYSLVCRGKKEWAALKRRPRTRTLVREYLEIRTHLLGEHLFKDSQLKYTKAPDISATWRPDADQRQPAAINGEETEEREELEGLEGSEGGRQDPVGPAAEAE